MVECAVTTTTTTKDNNNNKDNNINSNQKHQLTHQPLNHSKRRARLTAPYRGMAGVLSAK
jgi:hypothetical protein